MTHGIIGAMKTFFHGRMKRNEKLVEKNPMPRESGVPSAFFSLEWKNKVISLPPVTVLAFSSEIIFTRSLNQKCELSSNGC
jgi:hypothetical protein